MSATGTPSYAFPEGVLAREVSGEMVLLNLKSEQYYGLDAVGAEMVKRLTRESVETAVADLCRMYEVNSDALRTDLDALIQELMQEGLLERVPAV